MLVLDWQPDCRSLNAPNLNWGCALLDENKKSNILQDQIFAQKESKAAFSADAEKLAKTKSKCISVSEILIC